MENKELVQTYIERIENALKCVDDRVTKLVKTQFDIQGMSSYKTRIFLNELVKQDTKYLEIGNWYGSTFISALYANEYISAVAMDNFSEFGSSTDELLKNIKESSIHNYEFYDIDCFNISEELKKSESMSNINLYFYDGAHDAESQKKALTYYNENLSDVYILIVDDWNYGPAREGTLAGFREVKHRIHKYWELPARFNGDIEQWWNGLYVAVCEKQ